MYGAWRAVLRAQGRGQAACPQPPQPLRPLTWCQWTPWCSEVFASAPLLSVGRVELRRGDTSSPCLGLGIIIGSTGLPDLPQPWHPGAACCICCLQLPQLLQTMDTIQRSRSHTRRTILRKIFGSTFALFIESGMDLLHVVNSITVRAPIWITSMEERVPVAILIFGAIQSV